VFVYNKKYILDYWYYKITGVNMGFIAVQALAERNYMEVADVKKQCRHLKVKINNSVPGVYMVDEDDYNRKLSNGAETAQKRTITKSHQKKMAEGKLKKNS